MANEITYSTRIAWARGGEAISLSASDTYTQLGNVAIGNIQYIDVTATQIIFGNVLDPVFVSFRNEAPKLDKRVASPLTQVYMSIDPALTTTTATVVLDGGQGICVPNGGIVWYALAVIKIYDPSTDTFGAALAGPQNVPLAVVGIER